MLARLRPYLSTAALALLIFYFGVHAFTGEGGLLRSDQRDATLVAKTRELAALTTQREDLEVRARLLRDTSLSRDLREVDVDILTLGQYLRPSNAHIALDRYVTPEEFRKLYEIGMEMGFRHVESGPLVRSSYHAWEQVQAAGV